MNRDTDTIVGPTADVTAEDAGLHAAGPRAPREALEDYTARTLGARFDHPSNHLNDIPVERSRGSERFHELLDEIGDLHDRKQADYGRPTDPFANVRASEDFGVEGWVGALVRANDKMRRLQKAAQGGSLSNEGVEDSLMDLAVYALIALVLREEDASPF